MRLMQSEMQNNVELLERNVVLLLNKLKDNKHAITSLTAQLDELKKSYATKEAENNRLKEDNSSLQLANSLLGSTDSNIETKHKIDALIREVDTCIVQLQSIE